MCWSHWQRWIFITRVSSIWFERRPLHEACIPHLEMWQMNTRKWKLGNVWVVFRIDIRMSSRANWFYTIWREEPGKPEPARWSIPVIWTLLNLQVLKLWFKSIKHIYMFNIGSVWSWWFTYGGGHQRWEAHLRTPPPPQSWLISRLRPVWYKRAEKCEEKPERKVEADSQRVCESVSVLVFLTAPNNRNPHLNFWRDKQTEYYVKSSLPLPQEEL